MCKLANFSHSNTGSRREAEERIVAEISINLKLNDQASDITVQYYIMLGVTWYEVPHLYGFNSP